MRITHADVTALFYSTALQAERVGIKAAGDWKLYRGQPVYTIVTIDEGTEGHRTVVRCLGTTAKEAYQALSFMREAFYLVSDAKN